MVLRGVTRGAGPCFPRLSQHRRVGVCSGTRSFELEIHWALWVMQPQPAAGFPAPQAYAYQAYPQQQPTPVAASPAAPLTAAQQLQQQVLLQHQQQQYAQQPAPAPGVAYAAYHQSWPTAPSHQQQQQPAYAAQQQPQHAAPPQHYGYADPATAAAAPPAGYPSATPAPSTYGHYAQPAALPGAYAHQQQQPPPPQQQQLPQQQQQQPLSLPLLATAHQPVPAAAGQSLAAYAYPGGGATPAVVDAVVGVGAVGQQQQQQPQQEQQQAITPQQVAQEAIAKTMAAMQQQQQLPPGHVFDNRRGYLHGNLIGEVRVVMGGLFASPAALLLYCMYPLLLYHPPPSPPNAAAVVCCHKTVFLTSTIDCFFQICQL